MVDRERKYHSRYRPELLEDHSMQESLNVNDTTEGAIDISKQRTGLFGRKKKSGDDYKVGIQNAGYDSDDERENAHEMFMGDLQSLRKYF